MVVPWVTFRLALRQDQARWLRDQRAQLYADMLAEAYAEQQYIEYAMASEDVKKRLHFTDLRLPPLERARLGARGTAFGSRTINQLFNQLQAEGSKALLRPQPDDGAQMVARVQVGGIFDKLEAAIRHELGADRILLGPRPGTASPDAQAREMQNP